MIVIVAVYLVLCASSFVWVYAVAFGHWGLGYTLHPGDRGFWVTRFIDLVGLAIALGGFVWGARLWKTGQENLGAFIPLVGLAIAAAVVVLNVGLKLAFVLAH